MSTKGSPLKKSLGFVIFIAFSAVIGYYIGKTGVHFTAGVPKLVKLWLLILTVPSFFIVIGIHEAGHAVAGLLVKFDFKMYVVGPFMWEKESQGWKFKWNSNVNTAGGMVICLPTGSGNLAGRFSIYALGGPLASLLLTLIAYILFRIIEFDASEPVISFGVAKYFFLLLSIFSLFILIVTIVPFRMGGFSSDGARALQLLSGGEKARFELLMLKIVGSTTGGIRPADLNKEELEEALLLADKTGAPMGVYISGIQHQVEFDGGSLDEAEKYLMKYINDADKIPDGIRNSVWVDAAFFFAFGREDLDNALIYWDKFRPSAMLSKAQILATEAAINFLKKDYATALENIAASRAELPNMLDKGVCISLTEKLSDLEKRVSMSATL